MAARKPAKAPDAGIRYKVVGNQVEKWEGVKCTATHKATAATCDCKSAEHKPDILCVHRGMILEEIESEPRSIVDARRAMADVLHKLRLDKTVRRVRLPAEPYKLKNGKVTMVTVLAEGTTRYKLYETHRDVLFCIKVSVD